MERKIGEIFEYNGEWYQCIIGHCNQCSFDEAGTCKFIGNPYCAYRNDKKLVCFKKLEKVGEPFISAGILYQHYKVFDIDNVCGDGFWCVHNYKAKTLTIEIKQNKEDMEEKKLNLKPFDIQKAREGKPVCTRDGRKARIIAVNLNSKTYPLAAVIENNGEENEVHNYTSDGLATYGTLNHADLMMLTEKKEGWVNVYREESNNNERLIEQTIYKTRKDAFEHACPQGYITTTKINWEE